MEELSDVVALRNAERALDAIHSASPLTRRRVTDILHTYNSSIERKIERLHTMLHHDATELFAMASNESALPFRAIQAEVRRMFLGANHMGAPTKVPSSASDAGTTEVEKFHAHLLESSRFDALESQMTNLIREISDQEALKGRVIERNIVHAAEDTYAVCTCPDCADHTTTKLDKMLSESLAKALDRIPSQISPSLGTNHSEAILPSHLCQQMQSNQKERLLLELESIELTGHERRLENEIALIKKLQDCELESPAAQGTEKEISPGFKEKECQGAVLSDHIISYCERLVEHSSAVAAQHLDSNVLAWCRASWEVSTRLAMLSRLLDGDD